MYTKTVSTGLVALMASLASAQTFSACKPTEKECPPAPALGGTIDINYAKGGKGADSTDFFKNAAGTTVTYGPDGAMFTIDRLGQAPTIISNSYIFFGKLEVEMKVAPGVGIVSSIVLQSDDLDEIDWEWLGGVNDKVQTNYFSKGDTSTYDRGGEHAVSDPHGTFHTYTIDWTPQSIKWLINGALVRELKYADAKKDGKSTFPQTPCQVRLGTWVAGNPANEPGTIQWGGGLTDFSKGPFIGYYRDIKVTDYMYGNSSAKQYVYTGRSGSMDSILVDGSASPPKPSTTASTSSTQTTAKPTTSGTPGTTDRNSTAATTTPSQTPTGSNPTSGQQTSSTGVPPGNAGAMVLPSFALVGAAALFSLFL